MRAPSQQPVRVAVVMRTNWVACLALISTPLWAGWEAIGPFGGSAAVVQVDRHHLNTVLAATSHAQLFISEDDGGLWRNLPFPAELRATLHAFVVDHQTPGVFLVGLSSEDPEYSGIFRTTDGGRAWRRLTNPGLQEVWSIAIWRRDSRVIAAGTLDGIFLTRDGGESWEHTAAPGGFEPKPVVSLEFDPLDSNTLYAGTPHLAWKTVDRGVTWSPIHEGMLNDSDVFSILIDNRHHEKLFVGACGGIYRSLHGGEKWTRLRKAKGTSERTYQIAQHPLRPNILLAATASGLAKSVDGGVTWSGLSTRATRWIAFDPRHPDRIFVATDDEGIFRSDDLGEHLETVNRGFSNRRLSFLAESGNALYVGVHDSAGSSILRRMEQDNTWEAVRPAQSISNETPTVASPDSGLVPLVAVDRVAVSSISGESWTANLPSFVASSLKNLPFATSNRSLSGAIEDSINRTDDPGRTGQSRSRIYAMVTTEDHGLVAATSQGLMRSDFTGINWERVPGVLGSSTVTFVCKHPARAGVLFASQYGVIFVSKDDGRSWTQVREGALGGVSALLVVPGKPDRLFVLTESRGVYALRLGSE